MYMMSSSDLTLWWARCLGAAEGRPVIGGKPDLADSNKHTGEADGFSTGEPAAVGQSEEVGGQAWCSCKLCLWKHQSYMTTQADS